MWHCTIIIIIDFLHSLYVYHFSYPRFKVFWKLNNSDNNNNSNNNNNKLTSILNFWTIYLSVGWKMSWQMTLRKLLKKNVWAWSWTPLNANLSHIAALIFRVTFSVRSVVSTWRKPFCWAHRCLLVQLWTTFGRIAATTWQGLLTDWRRSALRRRWFCSGPPLLIIDFPAFSIYYFFLPSFLLL